MSSTLGPGMPQTSTLSPRAWVEFRSRIGNRKCSAHMAWCLAGVLEALIHGDIPRARARTCLGLLQLDQTSIDRGSWALSSELSLEQAPPMATLSTHAPPSVMEGEPPFSKLLDPRWSDIAIGHLRDQEEYLSKRRNIGKFSATTKDKETEETANVWDPKKRAKAKPKAKAQAAEAKQE